MMTTTVQNLGFPRGPDRGPAERLSALGNDHRTVGDLIRGSRFVGRYTGPSKGVVIAPAGRHRFGRLQGERVYLIAEPELRSAPEDGRAWFDEVFELLADEYHDIEARAAVIGNRGD